MTDTATILTFRPVLRMSKALRWYLSGSMIQIDFPLAEFHAYVKASAGNPAIHTGFKIKIDTPDMADFLQIPAEFELPAQRLTFPDDRFVRLVFNLMPFWTLDDDPPPSNNAA